MAGVPIALCGLKRGWVAVVVMWACWAAQPSLAQQGPQLWQSPAPTAPPTGAAPMGAAPVVAPPMGMPAAPPVIAPPMVAPPQMNNGLQASLATANDTVVDVRIVGSQSTPLTKIVPHVRTRAGRPFDQDLLESDVRRLSQTRMFVNVKTFIRRVDGGVVVVFEVLERPTLHHVKFVGNESYNAKTLKKETDLKSGDPMDPFAVTEGKRKIEEYYKDHGYTKCRVTILEGDKPGDQGAVFLINEGLKQKIRWTSFVGNTIASEARLRTLVESTPGILWLFKGELDRKKIEEDQNKLTDYYHGLGFFQVRVGHTFDMNEKQTWATVIFVIDEGPRSFVRNLSVLGNKKFATAEITEKLDLTSQKPFNKSQMDADVQRMRDKYGALGYVFADVKPEIRYLEQPGQVDLIYTIDEGARYRCGRININIEGEYPRTSLATVLNRLSVRPGDIIDVRELRDSERRLKAAGLFEVKPQEGVQPKIVYNPPAADKDNGGGDDKTNVAGAPPKFRGQNPEPVVPVGYTVEPTAQGCTLIPTGPQASSDSVLDLTVTGRWLPPEGQPQIANQPVAPPAAQPQPGFAPVAPLPPPAYYPAQPGYAPQPGPPVPAYQGPSPYQQPGYPPPQSYLTTPRAESAGQAEPPMVVRGQNSLDAGVSIPQSDTPLPNYGGYRPASPGSYNSYPPAPVPPAGYPQPSVQLQQPLPAYNSPPTTSYPAQPAPGYSTQPAPYYAAQPAAPQLYNGPPAGPPAQANPPGTSAPTAVQPPSAQMPPVQQPLFPADSSFSEQSIAELSRPLPLDVITRETETGRLMLGVGVNSDAGLFGQITLDERNFDWTRVPTSWQDIADGKAFRGAGEQFRLEAVPGIQFQRYSATFREPYLFNTDVSLMLSGYYFNRLYNEWTETRMGGKPGLGYQFTHELSGMVSVRMEQVTLTNPIGGDLLPATPMDIKSVVDHGPANVFGFEGKLAHDTRDSAFLPTQGHLYEITFEQVVGTYQYPHAEVDLRKHFTLYQRPDGSGRHVLSLIAKFGVTGDDTPVYDRYFAGGFSTIRGFAFRGVSPRSPNYNVAIGGDTETLASAEYMFPITADDMLRGVVFCDTGTVEPTISHWTDAYRVAPGFGLRITVPALGPAPIALDLAFPVSTQGGDRISNFSFFIGIGK